MTGTLVRDTEHDGHWFVYVDGFLAGELISNLDSEGWPISYSHIFAMSVSQDFNTLAEAEHDLMLCIKQRSQHNYSE